MICVSGAELDSLLSQLKVTQRAAFASGTYKNFATHWESYMLFCIHFGRSPLPASVESLCLFVQFLANSLKSANSVKNYLRGVKVLHLFANQSVLAFDDFQLSITLKGVSRNLKHVPRQAEPITVELLLEFRSLLDLNRPRHATFWCVLLLGFFCMLRKSNLVPDSQFDVGKQLCRSDIKASDRCLLVTVKWSKTIQFSQKHLRIPVLAIPGSKLCPVAAYANMTRLLPGDGSSPAFLCHRGSRVIPFSYAMLQSQLKALVKATGRDLALYSSHSIRRGGATAAFRARVPGELIKVHGDWASDAYLRYLHVPLEQRVEVAGRFRDFVKATEYNC